MRKVLQFSEGQLQRELFACIKHLLAAGDENSTMRSFLYQTCLMQGATGGLIGMNPSLATQPGGDRSGFRVQSVGIIGNEIVARQLRERTDVDVDGWDTLVSVVTKLGWSQSQSKFSKSFGTVGDPDFCQLFGYAVRSNFGDVLGFVIYATPQSDPFAIADRNTTLVSQLYLFRLLELLNIRHFVRLILDMNFTKLLEACFQPLTMSIHVRYMI